MLLEVRPLALKEQRIKTKMCLSATSVETYKSLLHCPYSFVRCPCSTVNSCPFLILLCLVPQCGGVFLEIGLAHFGFHIGIYLVTGGG